MRLGVLITILISFSLSTFAQDLSYPELQVTPRATDRVKIELREEAGRAWTSHLAVQLSGLATLVAGSMAGSAVDTDKDEKEISPKIAMGVGLAWLGATSWAAASYRPYRSFYNDRMRKMSYKTQRDKLTAERLAEEEINSLRKLGTRIRWYSAVTNLAASGFLMSNVDSDSDAHKAAGLSALLALGPLFFNYHWEDVATEQEKYKKKIFAPIAMAPIMSDPFSNAKASGVSLIYQF